MTFVSLYTLIAFLSFISGIHQTYHRQNPYGLTRWLLPFGIFVWGDAVVFGAFWTGIGIFSIFLDNFRFFLIVQAVFWIVRSGGEIIYWLSQQFSSEKRDKPHTLLGHKFFPGESIWFAHQIVWQVVLVIASVSLIYLL